MSVPTEVSKYLGQARKISDIWGNFIYNVKSYGVYGDGITDDTAKINELIQSMTCGKIVFPPGVYVLSKQGTRLLSFSNNQRGYGILMLNKSNIVIEFEPGAIIKVPVSDISLFNSIWIENCDNVEIINAQFLGTGTTSTRILEEGIGISITKSKRVKIADAISTNMRGCTRAYNSSDITIKDSFSTIYKNQNATGHFVLASCMDSEIINCDSYGATEDGDIFIYGANTYNCSIVGCKAHSYIFGDDTKTIFNDIGQGIEIDSGGRNCKIVDCYAYGYYAGIGFKNASEGATIIGNTAEKCKVGIICYKGDSPTQAPNNLVNISGNTIIPNGGNGNTNTLVGPLTGPFGLMVMDCYGGANIQNNMIYNSQDTLATNNFIGLIIGISDNANDSSQGGFVVSGNTFAFENRLGTNYGQNQNQAIYITSQYTVISVVIENNQFDLPYSGMLTNVIEAYNVQGLSICNNNFSDYNTTGLPVIKFSGCQRVNINGNTFGYHWGLVEGYNSQAIGIIGNVSGESINTVATPSVLLDNCQWINVNGNTQMAITSYNRDSFYYKDQNGCNWVNMQGNTLHLINRNSTNYYSSVATNFSFANNIVG